SKAVCWPGRPQASASSGPTSASRVDDHTHRNAVSSGSFDACVELRLHLEKVAAFAAYFHGNGAEIGVDLHHTTLELAARHLTEAHADGAGFSQQHIGYGPGSLDRRERRN